MSRRKPPVTTKSQREAMAAEWERLRAEARERLNIDGGAHGKALADLLLLAIPFNELAPPTSGERLRELGEAMHEVADNGPSIYEIEQATRKTVDRAAMVDVPRQYGATQTAPIGSAAAITGAPDINAMLKELIPKLSANWDRKAVLAEIDRAAREASEPAKPPASGWRSMASAPRDTGRHLAVVRMGSGYDLLCGEMCASGDWWRSDFGQMFDPEDLLAWAPIPDWTGEVGE